MSKAQLQIVRKKLNWNVFNYKEITHLIQNIYMPLKNNRWNEKQFFFLRGQEGLIYEAIKKRINTKWDKNAGLLIFKYLIHRDFKQTPTVLILCE